MHRLRVGGGVAGFIFTVGSLLVFMIGVPAFRPFLVLAIGVGALVAVVLRLLRRSKSSGELSLK